MKHYWGMADAGHTNAQESTVAQVTAQGRDIYFYARVEKPSVHKLNEELGKAAKNLSLIHI